MKTKEQEKQAQEEEAQSQEQEKKVIPYEDKYVVCRKYTKAADVLMLTTCLFSISFALPIANLLPGWLFTGLMIVFVLLLLGQFATQVAAEVYLYPNAEWDRVLGLFEDAFGKRLLDQAIKGYYDNSEDAGPDRLLANSFQSCFYTLKIARKKTAGLVIKNVVLFCVFFVAARIGMDNNTYLAGLQFFLSPLFLWTLLKHLYFLYSVKRVYEGLKQVFERPSEEKFPAVLRHLVAYEKALSAYGTMLDPSSDPRKPTRGIYHQLEPILKKEWEEMKKHHGIK